MWFAVRTNPRCEDRASKSIAAEGFEVYAPQSKKHIVHHRTRVLLPKSYPMLVGYVLARFPSPAHASHIRGCDGVKGVLAVAGVPFALPAREFDEIRAAEDRMNELFERQKRQMERKDHDIRIGDRVAIRRGPYQGVVATVIDAKSRRAITVMMAMFGGMVEVEAPVDFLERAA